MGVVDRRVGHIAEVVVVVVVVHRRSAAVLVDSIGFAAVDTVVADHTVLVAVLDREIEDMVKTFD
jgi:hypothetical protein